MLHLSASTLNRCGRTQVSGDDTPASVSSLRRLSLCQAELLDVKHKNIPKSSFPSGSGVTSALVRRPVAGSRAADGFFVAQSGAVAGVGGVGDTWTAWRRGGTGGRFGFYLQPLVSQSLGEVVINRHADGELLRARFLVVLSQAPLEMLLQHMVIVATGIH